MSRAMPSRVRAYRIPAAPSSSLRVDGARGPSRGGRRRPGNGRSKPGSSTLLAPPEALSMWNRGTPRASASGDQRLQTRALMTAGSAVRACRMKEPAMLVPKADAGCFPRFHREEPPAARSSAPGPGWAVARWGSTFPSPGEAAGPGPPSPATAESGSPAAPAHPVRPQASSRQPARPQNP